jgi:hypothetical protein
VCRFVAIDQPWWWYVGDAPYRVPFTTSDGGSTTPATSQLSDGEFVPSPPIARVVEPTDAAENLATTSVGGE